MFQTHNREALAVVVTFALLFCIAVLPVAIGWRATEASFDESRCYLPAIAQMKAKFPAVDILRDSLSASPPGYTHLLAALSFVGGNTLPAHRGWHFFLSMMGAVGLLWFVASMVRDSALVVAALLPAICSGYYLKSAAQLATDNAALVLSIGVTALAVFGVSSFRNSVLAGVLGLAASYIRHVAAWLAVPIAAKAVVLWLGKNGCHRYCGVRIAAWTASAVAVVCTLGLFVWAWKGLVPPLWARAHGAVSLTPIVYCLALTGLFAPVFLFAASLSQALSIRWIDVSLGALMGLVFFLLSQTAPNYEAGRWGGPLWALAGKLPLWGQRAPLFLPAAMLGGVCLAVAGRSLATRVPDQSFIWAASFAAWMATGIPNRQVFHRYYEGPVLAFLGLWLIALCRSSHGSNLYGRGVLYIFSGILFGAGVYSLLTSATGFQVPIMNG